MFEVNHEDREILLYDVIGPDAVWGEIAADDVYAALRELGSAPVSLRISSPGGDVWQALRMYNAIAEHGSVAVHVDALAASAASYVAMAGSEISMSENALMMIHGPWTLAAGNADRFREIATELDVHAKSMAVAYAKKADRPLADILDIFDGELWLTAEEAMNAGFADRVVEPSRIAARLNNQMFRFRECPDSIAASVKRFEIVTQRPQQADRPRLAELRAKLLDIDKSLTGC